VFAETTINNPLIIPKPIGVILAGGRGSRLGGLDKGLLDINGYRFIELCVANIRPQVSNIIISANRNLTVYRQFADLVVPDNTPECSQPKHNPPDYSGPLSGIISVMRYLEQNQSFADLVTVPCDMPFLPSDWVARLYASRLPHNNDQERAVVAYDGHRVQPLCTLLPWSMKSRLESFIAAGHRKAMDWVQCIDALVADFSDDTAKFININTQEDLLAISETISEKMPAKTKGHV
jgi:molybdenum cofactor guanylyltransferase